MMAPQAATCFRQWVILPEKCSGADAIMQAEMNRDIISAPCLTSRGWQRTGPCGGGAVPPAGPTPAASAGALAGGETPLLAMAGLRAALATCRHERLRGRRAARDGLGKDRSRQMGEGSSSASDGSARVRSCPKVGRATPVAT